MIHSNDDVSKSNNDLINQNTKMLSKIDKYQLDIEEKNLRISALEKETNNIKGYSYYSGLNPYGQSFTPGSGIKFKSYLSDKMEQIFDIIDGKAFVKFEEANLLILDEVIKKHPNFPFSYYAKYSILKTQKNPQWRYYAEKTMSILEITTTIEGHDTSHDQVLSFVTNDLNTK